MNIQELTKRLFRLEFLSDDVFEIDTNSPRFEEISKELFHELKENEIITHKGFAEKFECSCGGFLEETLQDGVYFCSECGNFEKINEERRIYKVDCESIFTMISNTLLELLPTPKTLCLISSQEVEQLPPLHTKWAGVGLQLNRWTMWRR